MTRIGLLGGTFDPPHQAHTEMAILAMDELNLDRLLFIPAFQAPLKGQPVASVSHRRAMLKLALIDHPQWDLFDFEMLQRRPVASCETVAHITSLYPEAELFLLIGADQGVQFTQWFHWEELLTMANVVCFGRAGFELPENLRDRITVIPFASLISSTQVRDQIGADNQSVTGLSQLVNNYIQVYRLYQ